ncbi:hypothetical protein G7068_00905 [Leucobacter viscericola]|uniref:Uncharacterized protein n=1 Tax=Leucobacter viscericola TaxID=2714935 RepID=A0A6G7XBF1_9MICO|nr:hypothetical protein [Leucobacter viscericola]QIK61930.1 hypothetical protein G7068_00905 [Leucobacter viscericola]
MWKSWKQIASEVPRIAAAFVVLLTLALCGHLLLSAVLVGVDPLFNPDDLAGQEEWAAAAARAAQNANGIVIAAAVGIAVVAVATAFAAWHRSKLWLSTGIISGTMLLAALVFVSATGFANLHSVAEHGESLRQVSYAKESYRQEGSPPTFTQAEIEAEIRTMITATGRSSQDGLKTPEGSATSAELVPIVTDSCSSASFAVSGDDDGTTLKKVLNTWREAGYTVNPNRVSSYIASSKDLPTADADIHDRNTINGLIGIRISGWCGTTPAD